MTKDLMNEAMDHFGRRAPIPLTDTRAQAASIASEVEPAMLDVLRSGHYAGGPDIAALEIEWAAYCGTSHAVAVGSGTDAVETLAACEGLAGKRVAIPASTFIATAEGLLRAGALVRVVDVEPFGWGMSPRFLADDLRARRVDAVMAVHMFGAVSPAFHALRTLSDVYEVPVFEDASQAHGATIGGESTGTPYRAGSVGAGAAFSCYPTKPLGAAGQAGLITTNDPDVARRARRYRDHGSDRRYVHDGPGRNAKMDALQAAILRVKLRHLDTWNAARARVAGWYDERLATLEQVQRPAMLQGHVWHLYVVRVVAARRDAVVAELNAAGVGAAVHYPTPVHLHESMARLGYHVGDFPVAEGLAASCISLPMFAELREDQVERVCHVLGKAVRA